MDERKYVKELKNLLIKGLEKSVKNKEDLAIALSGGVDSAVIAKLLIDLGIKPEAYVVGIEDCKDFDSAERVAKELELELKKIKLTENEIEKDLPVQVKILQKLYKTKLNPVSVSSNFPLFFVGKYAKEKYIISGMGADELFGGYAKYLKLSKEDSIRKIEEDTKTLSEFGYLENTETAKYFNKEVLLPFLDKDVVEFCLKLPYELKINNNERKYILRKSAKEIGLSEETSYKRKRAAQYGSGIMKVMKKIAKNNSMTINEYIKKLNEKTN